MTPSLEHHGVQGIVTVQQDRCCPCGFLEIVGWRGISVVQNFARAARCRGTYMRAVLAEDERELATWLVRPLAHSHFHVDWVDNGQMVRRSLKATRCDALILDLGLPRIGGHDVLADVRDADERLPVLILRARDWLIKQVSTK